MACAVKNTNNNPNDEKVLYPTPLSLKIIKSLKRYGVILVVTFLFVAIAVQWKDLSNYKGNTFSYVIANRNFLFSWAIYPFREFFFFFTSTPRGCRPEDCAIDGGAPFGTQLGSHLGIVGYSNCRSETCFSFQNYSPFSEDTALGPKRKKLKGVHSGMKWQCVEYARRYWMLRGVGCEGEKLLAATFDNVDGAAEIWELSEVLLLETQRVVPMVKIRNGFGLVDDTILEVPLAKSFEGYPIEDTLPRAGDLLLYSRDPQDFPYGHVGVLVAVELNEIGQNIIHCGSPNTVDVDYLGNISIGSVFIAEQNWDNKVWVGENFSRELPLQLVSSAENRVAYMIVDEEQPVLGWVRPYLSFDR